MIEHAELIDRDAKPLRRVAASINGHVIENCEANSIAIYERNGVSWVADFRDGRGELMNANTWFYFNGERLGYWHQRQPYGSAKPLPPEMLEAIERLHREKEGREAATGVGRYKMTLAEAAARLQRAVEIVDKANGCPWEQVPPRAWTAMERVSSLMSGLRSILSKTSGTAA